MIYADPPWRYTQKGLQGAAEKHYPTMGIDEIKSESWFYGLGFWTRGNAEVCLLATRGHPKRQAANVHQFIIAPIQEHSRKPDEARDKIVALMGDVPRVELFARQSPPGWDVWGNEVESTVPDFWTKCPEVGL